MSTTHTNDGLCHHPDGCKRAAWMQTHPNRHARGKFSVETIGGRPYKPTADQLCYAHGLSEMRRVGGDTAVAKLRAETERVLLSIAGTPTKLGAIRRDVGSDPADVYAGILFDYARGREKYRTAFAAAKRQLMAAGLSEADATERADETALRVTAPGIAPPIAVTRSK